MTEQKKSKTGTEKLDETQLDAAVGGASADDASIILCRKHVNVNVSGVAPCFKTAKTP